MLSCSTMESSSRATSLLLSLCSAALRTCLQGAAALFYHTILTNECVLHLFCGFFFVQVFFRTLQMTTTKCEGGRVLLRFWCHPILKIPMNAPQLRARALRCAPWTLHNAPVLYVQTNVLCELSHSCGSPCAARFSVR